MYEKFNPEKNLQIATLLRAKRKSKHLTLKQVAERAEINIRHYQQFESGGRCLATASFNTTMAVLSALEIDPDVFVKAYVKVYGTQEMKSATNVVKYDIMA